MKIVVIGGTGRIGSKVIKNLRARGHDAVAADLNTGVNTSRSPLSVPTGFASGYMRAKVAQEQLIEAAAQPYTIVRSTQFFEFIRTIADSATDGDTVRVPTAKLQPIAAPDVAAAVTEVAVSDPVNGVIEIAGPAAIGFPNSFATSSTRTMTHAQWSAIRTAATSEPS